MLQALLAGGHRFRSSSLNLWVNAPSPLERVDGLEVIEYGYSCVLSVRQSETVAHILGRLNTQSKDHEGIHKLRFTHYLHSLPRRHTRTTASRPAPTWLPQCPPPNSSPCSRITASTSGHGIRNVASHPSFNELACTERVLLRNNFPATMGIDYSALRDTTRH